MSITNLHLQISTFSSSSKLIPSAISSTNSSSLFYCSMDFLPTYTLQKSSQGQHHRLWYQIFAMTSPKFIANKIQQISNLHLFEFHGLQSSIFFSSTPIRFSIFFTAISSSCPSKFSCLFMLLMCVST